MQSTHQLANCSSWEQQSQNQNKLTRSVRNMFPSSLNTHCSSPFGHRRKVDGCLLFIFRSSRFKHKHIRFKYNYEPWEKDLVVAIIYIWNSFQEEYFLTSSGYLKQSLWDNWGQHSIFNSTYVQSPVLPPWGIPVSTWRQAHTNTTFLSYAHILSHASQMAHEEYILRKTSPSMR